MYPESDMLEPLKRRYNFETWAKQVRLSENLFVRNHFLSARSVTNWELQKTGEVQVANMPKCSRSLWLQPGAGPDSSVRCDTYECDSLEAAHELLVFVLGTFQSPLVEQRDDLAIGDIAFAPPGEASIVFARANVVFVVSRAGRGDFSVSEFAAQLDADLASKPEESIMPIESLNLSMASLPALGHWARLAAPESNAEPVVLKFFSPTGEIEAEGDTLVYKGPAGSEPEITVFAVDRSGRATRQTLRPDNETIS